MKPKDYGGYSKGKKSIKRSAIATGESDWGYETMEDIEKAEKAGFLEFADGVMTVYADMNQTRKSIRKGAFLLLQNRQPQDIVSA